MIERQKFVMISIPENWEAEEFSQYLIESSDRVTKIHDDYS